MSRYGIIADPHGNEEALVACMTRLAAERVDRILCLGDLVGYNASANECVRRVVDAGALAVRGNHDLIAIGELDFDRCADDVIYSLKQTRRDLSVWSRNYLRNLPKERMLEGIILAVHGGLDDVEQYLRTPSDIQGTAAALAHRLPEVRLLLFAHTHEPRIYEVDEPRVYERLVLPEVQLDRSKLTLINPGSVDASRKWRRGQNGQGEARLSTVDDRSRVRHAELCILDTARWRIRFLQVPYDHAMSEARARAAGYRISPAAARVYGVRRWLRTIAAAAGHRLALAES